MRLAYIPDEEGFIVEFELDADTAIEEFSSDDFDDAELDAELEAFDAIFESADETCSAELPEGLRAELAAQDEEWEAFELCLGGQFEALEVESTDEVHGIETGVWVSDGDSESFVIFGDDAGSVTISGNVEDLTIDGSGVEVLEGDELDALFDADPYDDVEDDVDH